MVAAGLVEIAQPDWDVTIDLVYAKGDNFTGRTIYASPRCYLVEEAAQCLGRAVRLAREQDLRLVITDAFRPSEAQWDLWNHTPDARFVADPRRGSPHSRGVAVDVTLETADGLCSTWAGPLMT